MSQSNPQYTPAQILEAARRVETDGRLEFAVQFFRHLVDYYPRSAEATIARSALTRLSAHRSPEAPRARGAGEAEQGQSPPLDTLPTSPPRPSHGEGGIPARVRRTPISIAPVPRDHAEFDDHGVPVVIRPRDRYWLSRAIAIAFSIVGWIALAAGVGLIAAVQVGVSNLSVPLVPNLSALEPWSGPVLIIGGLAVVLLCRYVRAMFDTANLLSELVEIERARAAAEHSISR